MPLLLPLCALLACGDDPDPPLGDSASPGLTDTACAAQPEVTWSNWGKAFFLTYCDGCHAETALDRHGAPESAVFVTLAQVRDQADRVDVRTLQDQDMPPGGGVLPEDHELLAVFLACGL